MLEVVAGRIDEERYPSREKSRLERLRNRDNGDFV